MPIHYSENISSRTAAQASGLTDSTTLLDIYSGGERSLSLAELKKVGQQVYNVKQYGATGNGSTDDTVAIQATIDACNTSGGGVVYLPNGNYKTSTTLNLKGSGGVCRTRIVGDKNFLDGTVIRPTMTDGSACIEIDALQYWHIENIAISHNSGSISNYIGINAINVAARWCLENVHVRLAAKGYFINGWIASAKNVWATYCTVGFEGDTINGGVMDLNIEVCETGLILDACHALTIHALVEGADTCIQAMILNDCEDIIFPGMHLEFDSVNLNDAIDIGSISACARILFNGGFITSYGESWQGYLIRVRNSTDITFDKTMVFAESTHRGRGILVESTSSRFRWSGRNINCNIQDNSTSNVNAVNLLPNHQFRYYLDELGYSYTTSATATRESLSSPSYIKSGVEALRLTSTSGVSLSRMGILVNPTLLSSIKGKTVTFGAWVYVPSHANFTIPAYPTNTVLLPGVITVYDPSGSTSSNTSALCIPDNWNFVKVTHAVNANATSVQLFLHCLSRAGGSGLSNGTEYVVYDSLFLCEGNLLDYDLMSAPPVNWKDELYVNGYWGGASTLDWRRSYIQTCALSGNATSVSQTLPSSQKELKLVVQQSGAGGYTISFPATWQFDSGVALQPATGVGSTSVYDLWYDGANVQVVNVKN